jgi:hypothetical protein
MKTATVSIIKKELKHLSQEEMIELVLRLSKFKKENKELLTYLLFEESSESSYVESVKQEIDDTFETINISSYFFIKKSVRKILRLVKKYIRYSNNKETEVELMLYFCFKLKAMYPPMKRDIVLHNIYLRQIEASKKSISKLHEDLQYDFERELEKIEDY